MWRENMSPRISVIIPAHNEEQYLPATLDSLAGQTYGHFEVVVVANGCTDRTEEVAKAKGARVIWLEERGLGRARNLGGKKAKGEILVFLDADTILEPRALECIAREFTRDHGMATLRGKPDSDRFSHKMLYLMKNAFHRTHLHYGSAGVIICWKDRFRSVRGFDESLQVSEVHEFMGRMRRFGGFKYIGTATATTSMRRYQRFGFISMAWMWLRIWVISLVSDLRDRHYEPVR